MGIELASEVSRAGSSACRRCDLPGQVGCLLRAALPGKTVTAQDPASLDLLDLLQRRQRLVVIVLAKAGILLVTGSQIAEPTRPHCESDLANAPLTMALETWS